LLTRIGPDGNVRGWYITVNQPVERLLCDSGRVYRAGEPNFLAAYRGQTIAAIDQLVSRKITITSEMLDAMIHHRKPGAAEELDKFARLIVDSWSWTFFPGREVLQSLAGDPLGDAIRRRASSCTIAGKSIWIKPSPVKTTDYGGKDIFGREHV
jgi:hypothetical protein